MCLPTLVPVRPRFSATVPFMLTLSYTSNIAFPEEDRGLKPSVQSSRKTRVCKSGFSLTVPFQFPDAAGLTLLSDISDLSCNCHSLDRNEAEKKKTLVVLNL